MTSKVTVEAHCADHIEVRVETFDRQPDGAEVSQSVSVIKNGQTYTGNVWDTRRIEVREVANGGVAQTYQFAEPAPASDTKVG